MRRLHAVDVHLEDIAGTSGYIAPTPIAKWISFLRRIALLSNPALRLSERSCRNIGHRLQMMEFQAAMLLLDREAKNRRHKNNSTLHETVSRMMMHQFAVTAVNVLEAIGTHLVRARENNAASPDFDDQSDGWIKAIVEQRYRGGEYAIGRTVLQDAIEYMIELRRQLPLVGSRRKDDLDFHDLTYETCFIPSYAVFRDSMTSLCGHWPDNTCLNEGHVWEMSGILDLEGSIEQADKFGKKAPLPKRRRRGP